MNELRVSKLNCPCWASVWFRRGNQIRHYVSVPPSFGRIADYPALIYRETESSRWFHPLSFEIVFEIVRRVRDAWFFSFAATIIITDDPWRSSSKKGVGQRAENNDLMHHSWKRHWCRNLDKKMQRLEERLFYTIERSSEAVRSYRGEMIKTGRALARYSSNENNAESSRICFKSLSIFRESH